MSFDWKKTVGAIAPTLATAMGGPLAGVAVNALSQALLGKDAVDAEELAIVVQQGGPEILAKIKNAENEFKLELKRQEIDIERIHASDRDSARKREASTHDSMTPRLLSFSVTIGFFFVVYAMLGGKTFGGNAWMEETIFVQNKDMILILLGTLGSAWTSIVAYYFGSSVSSRNKDIALRNKEQS